MVVVAIASAAVITVPNYTTTPARFGNIFYINIFIIYNIIMFVSNGKKYS